MDEYLKGPAFYDQQEVFDVYMNHRKNRLETPNDTLEGPVIWELAGDIKHQAVLDLGCGDGTFGLELLEAGANAYFGIDGSKNMIAHAQKNLQAASAKVEHAKLESWTYPIEQFDLAIARLVLHYIEDLDAVFQNVYSSLRQNGRFIFSVEHPVITSSEKRWEGKGKRQDWLVDDYFNSGQRENSWLGGKVVKYHRTVEQFFIGLQSAGFEVTDLREATPVRANFLTDETFERRKRIPLFLIFSGQKKG